MLFLFHGNDAYRLKEAVAAFALRHRDEHGSAALVVDLATDGDFDRLEEAIATPSFFAERRLIIARNPLTVEDTAKRLERCGAATSEDVDVVLVEATATKLAAGPTKALAKLEGIAHRTTACQPFTGAQAIQWVRDFCRSRDRTLEDGAAQELVRRIDGDGWALANELEKLCAYADTAITVEAVRALVAQPQSVDQWELSNALAGRDKRGSVAALWRKVREGTPEPLLVGAVASAVRTLVMVRDLADRGQPATVIAKTTGLHPFVVSKNLAGARAYTPATLVSAHRALAVLDRQAKTGQADAIDGLFSILLGL
jgi:DNA polymerase-3 subunit delta